MLWSTSYRLVPHQYIPYGLLKTHDGATDLVCRLWKGSSEIAPKERNFPRFEVPVGSPKCYGVLQIGSFPTTAAPTVDFKPMMSLQRPSVGSGMGLLKWRQNGMFGVYLCTYLGPSRGRKSKFATFSCKRSLKVQL